MPILDKIVTKIIREQELIVGPLAWSEAEKVQGLRIVDRLKGEVTFSDSDQKGVINKLVGRYERFFGQASHEVCREAVAGMLAELAPSDIPSSLMS